MCLESERDTVIVQLLLIAKAMFLACVSEWVPNDAYLIHTPPGNYHCGQMPLKVCLAMPLTPSLFISQARLYLFI